MTTSRKQKANFPVSPGPRIKYFEIKKKSSSPFNQKMESCLGNASRGKVGSIASYCASLRCFPSSSWLSRSLFHPRCQDHHPHINNERGNCAICIPTTFLRHNPSWLLATHSQSKATSSSRVVKTSSITNPNNH